MSPHKMVAMILITLAFVTGCANVTPTAMLVLPTHANMTPSGISATSTTTISPSTTTATPTTISSPPAASATSKTSLSGSGGGRIVFASKRDENYEIYVMNADGTDQQRLTNNPSEDGRPAWSPDCSQIAFVSDRSGHFDLYLMDADGSDVRRLTTKREHGYPAWSPDGLQLAFSWYNPGSDVYVMNVDGTNTKQLTQKGVGGVDMDISDPDWSPDGTQMVVVVDSNPDPTREETSIYVLDLHDILQVEEADEANLRYLARIDNLNNNPDWSPKGSQIAFSAAVDSRWGIYVINADGTNLRQLTQSKDFDEFAPSWSPDDTQIAFQSNPEGQWDIYVMNADGTGRRRLTTDLANDVDPNWCP